MFSAPRPFYIVYGIHAFVEHIVCRWQFELAIGSEALMNLAMAIQREP